MRLACIDGKRQLNRSIHQVLPPAVLLLSSAMLNTEADYGCVTESFAWSRDKSSFVGLQSGASLFHLSETK